MVKLFTFIIILLALLEFKLILSEFDTQARNQGSLSGEDNSVLHQGI